MRQQVINQQLLSSKNVEGALCAAQPEIRMDKDFLQQIETVRDIIPEPLNKIDDETLICECFCVSAKDIRESCSQEVDLKLLEEKFNLGQGCQSCLKSLSSWVSYIF